MKDQLKKIAGVGMVMWLSFVGHAQIPSDVTLVIQVTAHPVTDIPGIDISRIIPGTYISGIVSNTESDALYEMQYSQNKTNWMSLGFFSGSEITNRQPFSSWITNTVGFNRKAFRIRSWKDSWGIGMADWWQIKYFGNIGIDGSGNPMGDGWNNVVKYGKEMNPFKWYSPPGSQDQFPSAVPTHYPAPAPFAELNEVTAGAISKTILSVSANREINGYELTVLHPLVRARYLLLVRDKIDRQWRASGYFLSGTNRNSVHLHADRNGIMTDKQSPIALPDVKFLPDVVKPEFMAGWGEDSDGDGLPDIYEVLVTHTKPDDADTGDTGIPDGYRVCADDGWNNWKKFLYRSNPFKKCEPPSTVVLKEPTMNEMFKAQTPKTDLPYVSELGLRTNGAAYFQPYSLLLDGKCLPHSQNEHARCDVRVSWRVPPPNP